MSYGILDRFCIAIKLPILTPFCPQKADQIHNSVRRVESGGSESAYFLANERKGLFRGRPSRTHPICTCSPTQLGWRTGKGGLSNFGKFSRSPKMLRRLQGPEYSATGLQRLREAASLYTMKISERCSHNSTRLLQLVAPPHANRD